MKVTMQFDVGNSESELDTSCSAAVRALLALTEYARGNGSDAILGTISPITLLDGRRIGRIHVGPGAR
jgi:hypothetical protein